MVTTAVAALPQGRPWTALSGFLEHLARTPARELAEHYVATFDRRRRCCLYLTWWTDGETRRRGQSLALLKERYRRRRARARRSSELPDYLPVVLEYAATGDLADGLASAAGAPGRCRVAPVGAARCPLALCRRRRGGLCSAARARRRRTVAAAQRLAQAGPPHGEPSGWNRTPSRRREGCRHEHACSGACCRTSPSPFWSAGTYLAIPLRPVRLDHPVVAAVRVAVTPDRQPAVPFRHPGRGRRPRHRAGHSGELDIGGRD